ncbi:MAG TPA: hypothetical protein VI956_00790 [Nitrospirota bacterium]|nr:hypothetical protein [Nitrospirota bacterium]
MAGKEHKLVAKIKDYKQIFKCQAGERVMNDLMLQCHFLDPAFVKGDPNESAFMEGERNVVLRILKILNTSPAEIAARIETMEQKRREDANSTHFRDR